MRLLETGEQLKPRTGGWSLESGIHSAINARSGVSHASVMTSPRLTNKHKLSTNTYTSAQLYTRMPCVYYECGVCGGDSITRTAQSSNMFCGSVTISEEVYALPVAVQGHAYAAKIKMLI